jgi:hypothetical protein
MLSIWVRFVFIYLALPHLIFYWGWLKALPAALFTLILSTILTSLFVSKRNDWSLQFMTLASEPNKSNEQLSQPINDANGPFNKRNSQWTVHALVYSGIGALGLLLLSGVGGFGHFNGDLAVVHSMMRNLVEDPWPVSFFDGTKDLIYYFGLVLPASAIGKVFPNLTYPAHAIFVWTGFFLFLFGLFHHLSNPVRLSTLDSESSKGKMLWLNVAIGTFTVILFGGLDAVAWKSRFDSWPEWGTHIEWWHQQFQWSSFLTQLVWVPRHAVPAWIGVMYLSARRASTDSRNFSWRSDIFVLSLIPFWSPFVALGLLPFFTVCVFNDWRADRKQLIPILGWGLLCLCMALPSLIFLGSISGSLAVRILPTELGSLAWMHSAGTFAWMELGPFLVICGLFLLLMRKRSQGDVQLREGLVIYALAVFVLVVSLCVHTDRFNDFTMRVSLPGLLILSLLSSELLMRTLTSIASHATSRTAAGLSIALTLLLIVQSGAGLHEAYRALTHFQWQPQTLQRVSRIENLRPEFFLTQRLGEISPLQCAWLFRCPKLPARVD